MTSHDVEGSGHSDLPLPRLEAQLQLQHGKGLPPVMSWNPPTRPDIGLAINRDGRWMYQNSPIERPALVRLFSTVLRRDDDGFFLVTPQEKVPVLVDDAPFRAVELELRGAGTGQQIIVRTNVDDVIVCGPGHPIRFECDPTNQGIKPYCLIRDRLEALFTRSLTLDLMNFAEAAQWHGEDHFGVWSSGEFFAIGRPGDLGIDGELSAGPSDV